MLVICDLTLIPYKKMINSCNLNKKKLFKNAAKDLMLAYLLDNLLRNAPSFFFSLLCNKYRENYVYMFQFI